MSRLKKVIFLSILVSMGLVLSLFESTIPIPVSIPGAKLGLSNMVVLITLVVFGFKEGLIVSSLKSIVLMLITGSVSSFLYSFSGAVFSSITMYLSFRYFNKIFSIIGVSIIGAISHNFAQVTVAALILKNLLIYTYLPILMLLSLFTGYFVGLASIYIITHMEENYEKFFK